MARLQREVIEVTPFMQNCQILWEKGSSDALIVDPGGDVPKILSFLAKRQLVCKEIWLTHSHLDHCGGVLKLKNSTGAMLFANRLEKDFRQRVEEISALYGIPSGIFENCPEPDVYLEDRDVLERGGLKFEVLFTPGHSPGHICFYEPSEKTLIAGDTLFNGSIGRTDLPGCDHAKFMRSIKEKLLVLPEDTLVCPGHGPDTSIGDEKRMNPFLRG